MKRQIFLKGIFSLFLITFLVVLFSLPVKALDFSVQNNYEYLKNFSQDQEEKIGVFIPPSTAVKVAEENGVGIYDTASRRFNEGEADLIKKYINFLPQKFKATPPKAIVSVCCSEAPMLSGMETGQASGPYIYLGDNFFVKGFLSGTLSDQEKLAVFVHETTHVVQYYYTHRYYIDKQPNYGINISYNSTLVYDFAPKVGWDNHGSDFFNGYISWTLKDDPDSQMTTSYGRHNGPEEDEADSFGEVFTGQPQLFSQARVDYVTSFLGQDLSSLVRGYIPQYPKSERGSFSYSSFLANQITDLEKTGKKLADKSQWFAAKGVFYNDVVNYYDQNLSNRGFVTQQAIKKVKLDHNEDYAYGIYTYNGKTYLVTVLDFSQATGYAYKPEQVIITVLIYSSNANYLGGDFNQDGRVDITDLRQLFNGFTNIFDYNLLVGNFGRAQ